ncbi:MAG TPA: DMT family transporter [Burkholderiaceae bacterium]|nr:DMT family transporter [Burkholderiaceae bacterium]
MNYEAHVQVGTTLTTHRSPFLLPALALTFNAFVWGVLWWPFRQMQALGLHPLWCTCLVYAMAVVVIGMARPGAWAGLRRAPSLWVVVLASGGTNAAFNWAVSTGDVVRVVLLFYLMPLWAVLLARWLLNEPITPASIARVALALAGAAVVLWPEEGGWPWPRDLPDTLAIIGGLCFALNNVMLRREAGRPNEARALAMFTGGALVAGTVAALLGPGNGVPWPSFSTAWFAPALALGAVFLLSNLALQFGAARLPAHATAVIMMSEVLFASVSALALGGGRLNVDLALGGAAIVTAALLAARQR